MINNILIEICCGSVDDCITAQKANADRIELNHALEMGGMTPSLATLKLAKKHVNIPICCMVRPRGYGFNYTDLQYEVMKQEAKELIDAGADGIVFGFLNEDSTINVERTKEMVSIIKPKEAIFHKAFDSTPDLEASLKTLIECGIDRVLTSGGAVYPNIIDGCKILGHLNDLYSHKIQILPGGGVRENNVVDVLKASKSNQVHMTSKHLVLDKSTQKRATVDNTDANHSYVAVDYNQLIAIMKKIENV